MNITIPSADIMRLIQAHLVESGLHKASRALLEESGIGMAGSFISSRQWARWASEGQWAHIVQALSVLDLPQNQTTGRHGVQGSSRSIDPALLAEVHEMTILELADQGEWDLAHATLRLTQHDLHEQVMVSTAPRKNKRNSTQKKRFADAQGEEEEKEVGPPMTVGRLLEQKLAALASIRQKDPRAPVPDGFYGGDATHQTKQERRDAIGQRLAVAIPHQPPNRLMVLLQQAIKWQVYTGQLPQIRQRWFDNDSDDDDAGDDDEDGKGKNDDEAESNHIRGPSKSKKRRHQKHRKVFDLVLGEVQVDSTNVMHAGGDDMAGGPDHDNNESIPSNPYSAIKFGKNVVPECAIFLPDGSGLVTGSSDGLIEIWDPANQYTTLRVDLPYQAKEELLGHDAAVTALAITNDTSLLASGSLDGLVRIWRLDTGTCLGQIQAHAGGGRSAVSCLVFSPDGSRILTGGHDGACREFGLRTMRMLKEFRGHVSYLSSCFYHVPQLAAGGGGGATGSGSLYVVTASGDGSVRIWDGTTTDPIRILRPVSIGSHRSPPGSSIMVDHLTTDADAASTSPTIHTVISLHTPMNTLIVVPRGVRAFLVNYQGAVLRVFEDDATVATGRVYVAAVVSPSNRFLYAVNDNGACSVFNVTTGKLEKTIPDFGMESTASSRPPDSSIHEGSSAAALPETLAEISSVICHPQTSLLGAFSNHKAQKKGRLVLWK